MEKPKNVLASVVREVEVFLVLDSSVNLDKERIRLTKEAERLEKNIKGTESKLENPGFLDKAPQELVDYERQKLNSMKESLIKVLNNIQNLDIN